MKKKIITLLTITIIITLSLIFEKNAKERYRVDTNNSFNKNNTNIIYSAGTFKINPFNINEAVEEVDYIFIGKVDKYLGSYYNPEKNIMVYSNYLVDISKNLKGNLIDKVQLDMYGGYNDSDLYLISEGDYVDELLIPGKTYLFLAYGKVDGGLHLLELNGSIELDDANKDEIINNYKQQINKSNIKLNTSERKRYKSKYEL